MAGTTPIYGFPYPESSDLVADYPALGQDLAEDVETVIAALPSGGLSHIGTESFSAVSSVSLNGVFTSAYDNYRIIITSAYSIGTNGFMRLRASGTDNTTASSYVIQDLTASSTSVNGGRITADSWRNWSGATTLRNSVSMDLYSPYLASATGFTGTEINASSGAYLTVYVGTHNQTTSYDGFTIYPGSGNITGTLRVYGYQNS